MLALYARNLLLALLRIPVVVVTKFVKISISIRVVQNSPKRLSATSKTNTPLFYYDALIIAFVIFVIVMRSSLMHVRTVTMTYVLIVRLALKAE